MSDNWNSLIRACGQIGEAYSSKVLGDYHQLKALLSDFAPSSQKEIKVLVFQIRETEIVNLITSHNLAISYTIKYLSDEGLSSEWAKNISICLYELLQRNYSIDEESSNAEPQHISDTKYSKDPSTIYPNKKIENFLKLAFSEIETNNYTNAESLFKEVLIQDINSAEAYLGLAMISPSVENQDNYLSKFKKLSPTLSAIEKQLINNKNALLFLQVYIIIDDAKRIEFAVSLYPQLITNSSYYNDINSEMSILSWAVWNTTSINAIKKLLALGADPNYYRIADIQGGSAKYSILNDAIWRNKNYNVIKVLLDNGANINSYRESDCHELKDKMVQTKISALFDAINFLKKLDVVELLLEYGADANQITTEYFGDTVYKWTMLTLAITQTQSADIVKLLIRYGADVNKNRTAKIHYLPNTYDHWMYYPQRYEDRCQNNENADFSYPLSDAIAFAQSPEIVKTLIENGADWNKSITLRDVSKTIKKYPFIKKYHINEKLIETIKSYGWKGSLFN